MNLLDQIEDGLGIHASPAQWRNARIALAKLRKALEPATEEEILEMRCESQIDIPSFRRGVHAAEQRIASKIKEG